MRFKVALALSISAFLVVGAAWTRHAESEEQAARLISVDTAEKKPAEIDPALLVRDTSAPPEPLTDTDLVSRQLFSDYFSLVARGQATPENVDKLAESYAESIASLSKANQITVLDLNIVSNTGPNIAYYDSAVGSIYTKYRAELAEELIASDTIVGPGTQLDIFSNRVSKLYADEAGELQALPVPAIAVKDHLELVNNYLKASASYRALAQSETNVVNSMAGVSLARESIAAETQILESLQKTLSSGGIMNSNQ